MLSFGCLSEAPNREARKVQFGFNLPRVQTHRLMKPLASRTIENPSSLHNAVDQLRRFSWRNEVGRPGSGSEIRFGGCERW